MSALEILPYAAVESKGQWTSKNTECKTTSVHAYSYSEELIPALCILQLIYPCTSPPAKRSLKFSLIFNLEFFLSWWWLYRIFMPKIAQIFLWLGKLQTAFFLGGMAFVLTWMRSRIKSKLKLLRTNGYLGSSRLIWLK